MQQPNSPADTAAKHGPLADRAAVGLLCAAAVAGPLALGGTGPWSRFALEAAMASAAAIWAASGSRDRRSLLLPLVAAGILLLQLVPLPIGLLVSLAPVSAGRWMEAIAGAGTDWASVSVEPSATAVAIGRLFLGTATIAVVASLARTPAHRRWLYTALATSAAVIWAAGVAFPVNPDNASVMGFFSLRGPIDFWKTPELGPLQTSGYSYLDWVVVDDQRYQADGPINGGGCGSYIYSNHFANALCLTLPAAWALWMLYTRNRLPLALRWTVLLGSMLLAAWTTGGMARSRAGTGAFVFASLVYVAFIAQARWLRWTAGGLAAAIATGLTGVILTIQGPLSGLLAILPEPLERSLAPVLVDARVVAAKVAGRMFLASPVLGTGLGSYGDLYPLLRQGDYTMYFAHNDYAQLLAESGLVGAGMLALAAWTLGTRFVRFGRERPPANRLIDAAAWAALAGAAAHSVFDWNMHAPANALIACIVAGLAASSVVPNAAQSSMDRATWPAVAARFAFVTACGIAVALLVRDASTSTTLDVLRRANTAARVAALKSDAPRAVPALTAAVARGTAAARLDPRIWQLPMMLGHANLHLARAASGAAERDTRRNEAQAWFLLARRASAAIRGLPEPLPRTGE